MPPVAQTALQQQSPRTYRWRKQTATKGGDADAAVVRAATQAQRRRLVALRADGTIGDAAFQRVEEELDWAELDWGQFLRVGQRGDAP